MLGRVQLAEQTVGSSFIPPGTAGVIGSGTLINYNLVLVDYTEGGTLPRPRAGRRIRPP
jgi:hypothetical protein